MWRFTQEDLESRTPSRAFFAYDEEMHERYLLYLYPLYTNSPQYTIATAQLVAITALYLAGKVEETPKKIKEILTAYFDGDETLQKLLINDVKQLQLLRSKVLELEQILLETLCFDLNVEHPFKFLKSVLISQTVSQDVCQIAWKILSDSMLSPLILIYDPSLIAYACFWISISKCSDMQNIDQHFFAVVADPEDRTLVLDSIVPRILSLYKDINDLKMNISPKSNQFLK